MGEVMTEERKKVYTKWTLVKYGLAGFSVGLMIASVFLFLLVKNVQHQVNWQRMHVKSIEAIDRNCNECHLGLSFINLFNNPYVKTNDNVVNKMMDNARIKRW